MADSTALSRIIAELAANVKLVGFKNLEANSAFEEYYDSLVPLAQPYIGNGFINKSQAYERFFSETALLHLTISLIKTWCCVNNLGSASKFFEVYPEAKPFSWYEVPQTFTSQIEKWICESSDLMNFPQEIALVAENTLAGLRRRALGEFFTTSEIAEHLFSIVNSNPTLLIGWKIADPACGSGNLLKTVVAHITDAVRNGLVSPELAITNINKNIFGFDIQPIAVLLTRLQLILTSLPIFSQIDRSEKDVFEIFPLPNIRLVDPLSDPYNYWDIFASFDLVIGNPPFMKIIKENLTNLSSYEEILNGQPNLYQLFLWWAIKATKSGGNISFLIPQSIRSGQYFIKLREKLSESCRITSITCFGEREGIFDTVDQHVMAIHLIKGIEEEEQSVTAIRFPLNGEDIINTQELRINQQKVIRVLNGKNIWCISEDQLDYDILDKVYRDPQFLLNLPEIQLSNGGYVWNQNKENLADNFKENLLPLISSDSIEIHRFTFPPGGERVSKRLFAVKTNPPPGPIYSNRAVLLKRTTPEKLRGRRIVATALPDSFLQQYPSFFAENHVNLITPRGANCGLNIIGLTAWLNSKLVNFVFGMMNGSSHLSKFELGLLPAPVDLINSLSESAIDLYSESHVNQRQAIMDEIDQTIFNHFRFTEEEQRRIKKIVSSVK